MTSNPTCFQPYERKVHLFHDQHGATYGLQKHPFANTLCRMNSRVPESHITRDPDAVTCKICRRDRRFGRKLKISLAPSILYRMSLAELIDNGHITSFSLRTEPKSHVLHWRRIRGWLSRHFSWER